MTALQTKAFNMHEPSALLYYIQQFISRKREREIIREKTNRFLISGKLHFEYLCFELKHGNDFQFVNGFKKVNPLCNGHKIALFPFEICQPKVLLFYC